MCSCRVSFTQMITMQRAWRRVAAAALLGKFLPRTGRPVRCLINPLHMRQQQTEPKLQGYSLSSRTASGLAPTLTLTRCLGVEEELRDTHGVPAAAGSVLQA